MAKTVINVGSSANDGTGDPLRTAMQSTNSNINEIYSLFGDGTTLAISGDATVSAGALTIANDAVENAMVADDAIDSPQIADGAVDTVHIADDSVSFEKVDAEFTTSSALTAGATVDVDYDAAQVFTLTPNANTTFNITNPKIGVTKTIIVTGAGSTYTADTWTVGGGAGTFNRIAGEYDDTSSTKNFYQITCISATEFWYSISQIAS
jgi:hypothetical protein